MRLLDKCIAASMVAVGCSAIALAGPVRAEPAEDAKPDTSNVESVVDKAVEKQLSHSKIPGAVVTVVADGETLLSKGYGQAEVSSKTPMDAKNTTFYTASEAKLYTAAAVLQLVDAGKLDLDADVNDYLKKFSIDDTFPGKPVTVGDLLTFTSGFDYDIYGWSQWDYEDMPSLEESAELMQPDRVREPGEYVAYNNYDFVLAGYLVEIASGQSYDDYVAEHVFEPLGMDSTTAAQPHPESIAEKLATGYRPDGDSQTETAGQDSPVTPAGGDTVTSSSDMAAFMTAQLENDDRLGTDVAKRMQKQQFTSDKRVPGMGFGFEQRSHNGHRMVLKDGDLPGHHHNMALLPDSGLGVHVYYNGDGENGAAFWNGKDLVNQIVDSALPSSDVDKPGKIGGDVSKYAGQYESLRTSQHTFARVSTLTAPVTVEATGDGELTTTGLSENPDAVEQQWVQTKPGLFTEVGGDKKIAFDKQGKLISSEVPVTAYERLDGLNSPTLHLVVLGLTVLILLAGLLWFPILALVRRLKGRDRHPAGAFVARIVAWTISLGLAMFVAGFAIVSSDPNRLMQLPLTGDLVLSIALNSVTVIGVLGIAAVVATIAAWARGWWTWKGRVSYTVMTVATLGFMWVAVTYNLIGLPFTLTV
ncbi:MAG: serine hydrolase domain-containing protein [Stackebrandtia sp.]